MRLKPIRALLFVALVLTCTFAASASASPAWKFNGTELVGSETIVGDAVLSSIVIAGVTNTCKKMHYEITIVNSAGTGKGELKALSFKTCFTNINECTIKSIGSEKLPWAVHLVTAASDNYVVIEGVKIGILYGGEGCILGGMLATVKGSAGARFENASETFTFDLVAFGATGTALSALGSSAQWNGAFTTEATGAHSGQALTVS